MDSIDENEDLTADECSSRKSSIEVASDGNLFAIFDRQDSSNFSESETEYFQKMLAERRGSFRPQPKETVPYEVQVEDTLEGIAARYNIMPSELTVLNRLSSRTVFPGQILFIPEKNSLLVLQQILEAKNASLALEQNSPKPGHAERVPETDSNGNETQSQNQDASNLLTSVLSEKVLPSVANKSLKINSKHVTDGEGVVSGILLVTPNLLMFDPNVSDPLVMEYGMEKYGVVAQMEYIVRIALYPDIFRMRSIRESSQVSQSSNKMNLYHAHAQAMRKSSSYGEKINILEKSKRRFSSALESGFNRLTQTSSSAHDILSKICEIGDHDEVNEVPEIANKDCKTVSRSISCSSDTTSDVSSSFHMVVSEESSEEQGKETSQETLALDASEKTSSLSSDEVNVQPAVTKKKTNFERTKHKLHKGLRKLSLTGDGLFSNGRRMSLPSISPSFPDFKSKSSLMATDKKFKSEDKTKESSGTSYVNMVDEKPELFVSFDKLIPQPAKSFDDTPLYLCLRMGRPIQKTVHRSTPVVHFGQKMKSEYWFSIPKASVDTLYKFILRWYPEKYGDVDDVDLPELGFSSLECEDDEMIQQSVPLEHRRSSWAFPWRKGKLKDNSNSAMLGSSSPEDWEFLDNSGKESDSDLSMPELLSTSVILNEEQILQINKHLPARASSYAWTLIYSTAVHGFSLKTMYREMSRFDTPVLIAISNRSNAVFGSLLSCPLKMSDHFYGTGESFLFVFDPEFKCYRWSGENDYFIKGNTESFSVGASEGHFGLWLDDDLFHGHTNACQTFNNPPLCLPEDFVVRALEAWGFV